MSLRSNVEAASRAFRELSRDGASDAEAARAERALLEEHLPSIEAEDVAIGAAARATLRWMLRERAARKASAAAAAAVGAPMIPGGSAAAADRSPRGAPARAARPPG